MSRRYKPRPKEQPRSHKTYPNDRAKNNLIAAKPDPLDSNLQAPAGNIFAKWLRVFTRPSIATFASEMPAASWAVTFLGAAIYTIVYFLALFIGVALRGKSPFAEIGTILEFTATNLVGILLGLFLGAGLIYLLAKVGGGTGDFATQTYLFSLYFFPLTIISTLLGFIPLLGSGIPALVIFIVVGIYELFLTYYMVQATHRLSPGDALRLVILTFIVVFIILVVAALALIAILLNSVHVGI